MARIGLASTTDDLSVTSTLLGAPRLPGCYTGVQHWADGLGTAYFALLAPAAMGCIVSGPPAELVITCGANFILLIQRGGGNGPVKPRQPSR
jgi:hypothetical protein